MIPTIELPSGVVEAHAMAYAESHTAYDLLTEEDGWTEIYSGGCLWKEAVISGHLITVYPPTMWVG